MIIKATLDINHNVHMLFIMGSHLFLQSFYMITFYGGDHIEFSIKQFPDMIHEHIDALINYK